MDGQIVIHNTHAYACACAHTQACTHAHAHTELYTSDSGSLWVLSELIQMKYIRVALVHKVSMNVNHWFIWKIFD